MSAPALVSLGDTSYRDAQDWAQMHFDGIDLGDKRRTERAVTVAASMARHPGASIPRLFPARYDVKAAYTLFGTSAVTPDALQAQHRSIVARALRQPGTYLLLADSSDMVWTGKSTTAGDSDRGYEYRVAGLGPVGPIRESRRRGTCGFLLHSTLAVKWHGDASPPASPPTFKRAPTEVVGILDQQYHVRKPMPMDERASVTRLSRQHNHRERESHLWDRSVDRVAKRITDSLRTSPAGGANAQTRYVYVADRGADIFEVFEELSSHQAMNLGFVIRACQDRAIEAYALPSDGASRGGARAPSSVSARTPHQRPRQRRHHLISLLRARAAIDNPLGEFVLERRSRRTRLGSPPPDTIRPGEDARTIRLAVTAMRVAIRSPERPQHEAGTGAPVIVTALRVWEVGSSPSSPSLEWVLLTDREVVDFVSAYEVVSQYATRWLIEEFHKALKSGLGAERLQLETKARLFAAIALMSVVATRLVALKEYVRLIPDEPASVSGLSETE